MILDQLRFIGSISFQFSYLDTKMKLLQEYFLSKGAPHSPELFKENIIQWTWDFFYAIDDTFKNVSWIIHQ